MTAAFQPSLRPGQPPRPILPTKLNPGAVQPATPLRPQAPQPILPQRATPTAVQPHAGNAFPLPGNFTLKPRGSGQPLPETVQKKMEAFFNTNFADVRVHVGHEAPSIGALAFTHGTDLYFAPGQYNPQSTQGQQLLGHELTHVVQQRAGRVRNPLGSGVAVVQNPALEAEAERMGLRAATASLPVQAKLAHSHPDAIGRGQTSSPGTHQGSVQPKSEQAHSVLLSAPDRDGGRQIKVVSGGKMIGSVEIHTSAAGGVEITDLKVLQEHRRNGVGRELVMAALQSARTQGLGLARLEAHPSDSSISPQALVSMYQAFGFRRIGVSSRGNPLMGTGTSTAPPPSQVADPRGLVQRRPGAFPQGTTHATAGKSVPVILSSLRQGLCIQPAKKTEKVPTWLPQAIEDLKRQQGSLPPNFENKSVAEKIEYVKKRQAALKSSPPSSSTGSAIEYKKQAVVISLPSSRPSSYTPPTIPQLPQGIELGFTSSTVVSSPPLTATPPDPYGGLTGEARNLAHRLEEDRLHYQTEPKPPSNRYKGTTMSDTVNGLQLCNYSNNLTYSRNVLDQVGLWWEGWGQAYSYNPPAPKPYNDQHDVANFLFHHPTNRAYNGHACQSGPKSTT
jgi:ribosomal protein S18 acetylase RimI-like enzyme